MLKRFRTVVRFPSSPQKQKPPYALLEAEQYDEAITAFTNLESYRDSIEKVEEIRIIVLDKQYDEAEKLYNAGKYSEAINIYSSLGEHKEEQISNRLADGDAIYFGTYNENLN